ncbi:MAG TPA: LacI family DNA-binding transcriptional regulator [Candidatus Pelethocola excrementipullorum]|nr:LacI family DNA-binding transcriptional regulator [Candidatus Pelethocola excrementipullorum]
MGVTIKDIAKRVGVSPSTVSRVINGNTVISDETRKKIQEAMAELNYHPNSRARNFATGSTNTIALVIDAEDENTFSNTFFNRSVYAIEKAAQSNGYNLLITNDTDDAGSSISELVYEKKVDGLILPSSRVRSGLLELLNQEGFPYVVLGEPDICSDNLDWVDVNNFEGSKNAVTHLLDQGYKRIVFAAEDTKTVFSKKRIEGYYSALDEEKGCREKAEVISCGENYSLLCEKIEDAIEKQGADAFLCSNNVIAYHVMKTLKNHNYSMPSQVGIVTFDNYPFAEYMDPPLSAVDVDTYLLGEKAASLLIKKINKEEVEKRAVLIDTEFIFRDSSKRGGLE